MNAHDRALAVRSIVSLYREFEQVARRADISLGQYRTMLYLRTGPKNAGAIAAAGEIKKPTVSALLNSLRDKGWITTADDPTDARVTRVVLTPEGKARMDAFELELADRIDPLMTGLDHDSFYAALSAAATALRLGTAERRREVERQYLDE
jgi:DNA-binding MarR family transcriptional regulator